MNDSEDKVEKDFLDIVKERRYRLIDDICPILDQMVLVRLRMENQSVYNAERDKECRQLLGYLVKQLGLIVGYESA